MKPFSVVVIVGVALLAAGCSKNEAPQGEEVPLAKNVTALASKGEPTFTVPAGWVQEQPSSSMRKAQYKLPGEGGAGDAELAVFTGIGGSAEQNIERWIGQFKGPGGASPKDSAKISSREISGYKVTFLDVSGTFDASTMAPAMGAGAAEKENYRLLAAVIEGSGAPYFLKLTGPKDTVTRWEKSFDEYVSSVK